MGPMWILEAVLFTRKGALPSSKSCVRPAAGPENLATAGESVVKVVASSSIPGWGQKEMGSNMVEPSYTYLFPGQEQLIDFTTTYAVNRSVKKG